MTLTHNHKTRGENITNSITVLRETYQNIELLFTELDRIGIEQAYNCITPRFLRWKSDTDSFGWLISDFIKLYQKKADPITSHIPELREGPIYGVEIEFDTEEGYPILSLNRYSFDFSFWSKLPSVSDRWVFYYPFRNNNEFYIEEKEGIWKSVIDQKAQKKYWGLQNAISFGMPLLDIKSSEDVRKKIFEGFDTLNSL
jgi:hypothetical protein